MAAPASVGIFALASGLRSPATPAMSTVRVTGGGGAGATGTVVAVDPPPVHAARAATRTAKRRRRLTGRRLSRETPPRTRIPPNDGGRGEAQHRELDGGHGRRRGRSG